MDYIISKLIIIICINLCRVTEKKLEWKILPEKTNVLKVSYTYEANNT